MGRLGKGQQTGSPLQSHKIHAANDLLWITGAMETLGDPHNYVNQDGMDFIRIGEPHIAPWLFTGLPVSHAPLIVLARERIQFLMFTHKTSLEGFRAPPRTEKLVLHLPLAIIRGGAPFLSEAKIQNFLDFWKGIFIPIVDAEIYFLAEGPDEMPTQSPLVYVNRNILQSYIAG